MFNTKQFLEDHYNTPDGVIGAFNSFGIDIPARDTVRKWFARGSVPSEWLPLLIAVRELETGAPVGLASYISNGG